MNEHVSLYGAFMTSSILLLNATLSLAQWIQTGTVRGLIRDEQGFGMPRVAVTVSSPGLQGQRSAVTGEDGTYSLRALPPGEYKITFARDGFTTAMHAVAVPIGLDVERNVTLQPAGRTEVVQVVGELP